MHKYQVSIDFEVDGDFMSYIPAHRALIQQWINEGIVDSYAVSLETRRSWIVINADTEEEVKALLRQSPLYRYWDYEIDVIFVYDSPLYRFPKLVMN